MESHNFTHPYTHTHQQIADHTGKRANPAGKRLFKIGYHQTTHDSVLMFFSISFGMPKKFFWFHLFRKVTNSFQNFHSKGLSTFASVYLNALCLDLFYNISNFTFLIAGNSALLCSKYVQIKY